MHVIENMTALSESFPMDLHHDAIVLQFSSGGLTSKQKPIPHVSRESLKISVNGGC